MNEHSPVEDAGIRVSVFKNGRSRAIRIPKEFELAGETVIMSQQPDGSILIRTAETAGLIDYLKTAEPWAGEAFIGDNADLGPLDEIDLP